MNCRTVIVRVPFNDNNWKVVFLPGSNPSRKGSPRFLVQDGQSKMVDYWKSDRVEADKDSAVQEAYEHLKTQVGNQVTFEDIEFTAVPTSVLSECQIFGTREAL